MYVIAKMHPTRVNMESNSDEKLPKPGVGSLESKNTAEKRGDRG